VGRSATNAKQMLRLEKHIYIYIKKKSDIFKTTGSSMKELDQDLLISSPLFYLYCSFLNLILNLDNS